MKEHIAACPLCTSVARYDSHDVAYAACEKHNSAMHDGTRTARPIKPTRKSKTAFLNRAKREFGADKAAKVARKL